MPSPKQQTWVSCWWAKKRACCSTKGTSPLLWVSLPLPLTPLWGHRPTYCVRFSLYWHCICCVGALGAATAQGLHPSIVSLTTRRHRGQTEMPDCPSEWPGASENSRGRERTELTLFSPFAIHMLADFIRIFSCRAKRFFIVPSKALLPNAGCGHNSCNPAPRPAHPWCRAAREGALTGAWRRERRLRHPPSLCACSTACIFQGVVTKQGFGKAPLAGGTATAPHLLGTTGGQRAQRSWHRASLSSPRAECQGLGSSPCRQSSVFLWHVWGQFPVPFIFSSPVETCSFVIGRFVVFLSDISLIT